ncbi:hypothetical protein [Nonomuraea jiangxiensis]|nr:hypothetical protein [Nonomuraea jiangxiensis]
MSSDELKVPSQRGDHTKVDPAAKTDANVEDETTKGERDGRGDGYIRDESLTESDERARGEGEPGSFHGRGEDVRDRDGLRSPRADDEYAAAVPGAVSPPESGDTTYQDPYARTGGDRPAEPEPDTPGTSAGREPAYLPGATSVPGAAPAHALPEEAGLFDQDPAEVQARWRDLQASFVDDPGEAVQRADGLVGEVVESLTSSLNSRTSTLRGRWKDAEASDTEQLRLALRDYRNVLERLLTLSNQGTGLPDPNLSSQGVPGQGFSSLGMR